MQKANIDAMLSIVCMVTPSLWVTDQWRFVVIHRLSVWLCSSASLETFWWEWTWREIILVWMKPFQSGFKQAGADASVTRALNWLKKDSTSEVRGRHRSVAFWGDTVSCLWILLLFWDSWTLSFLSPFVHLMSCLSGALCSLWISSGKENCVLLGGKDERLRTWTLNRKMNLSWWPDCLCFLWRSRHSPVWECWVDEVVLGRANRVVKSPLTLALKVAGLCVFCKATQMTRDSSVL